jgi:hypothetical protein
MRARRAHGAHGKEGVNGSSPLEGSRKAPVTGLFYVVSLAPVPTCSGMEQVVEQPESTTNGLVQRRCLVITQAHAEIALLPIQGNAVRRHVWLVTLERRPTCTSARRALRSPMSCDKPQQLRSRNRPRLNKSYDPEQLDPINGEDAKCSTTNWALNVRNAISAEAQPIASSRSQAWTAAATAACPSASRWMRSRSL